MKGKNETFITSSNQLAAYLVALRFIFRIVKIDNSYKIELTGPGLTQAIESFYFNSKIPVQSYLAAFETLRGAVAIARGIHG